MARENPAEKAPTPPRSRLCDPNFAFKTLSHSDDSNFSSSITEACNSSILLLGPRGSGKIALFELVLDDLLQEFPDMISVIRLSGLLRSSDICAFKEIARQLCMEHQLVFSRMASFDDNSQFMIAMLRECGLAHKTIIFVLDEFDLFAVIKQRLLYSLLNAMQSVTSQAVVIGVSSRLDADMLLDKRVRSRFSHIASSQIWTLPHILLLPTDSSFPPDYAIVFNLKFQTFTFYFLSSHSHYLRLPLGFLQLQVGLRSFPSCYCRPRLVCTISLKLLDLLFWVYTKKLMLEQCLSIFDKMIRNRQHQSVQINSQVYHIVPNKISDKIIGSFFCSLFCFMSVILDSLPVTIICFLASLE
ncbi:origin recognition complex subunit 4 [Pyrus ussuriensis x Pyrus communis]|uniref:Origin recognition complex subunit 4 n=1 Tax=Pyrus ussuriensis x Pyrus communis TaxID=2448454 RepID=A0A5N5H376_9ROSA|nr:origin recognition complex subunit 4 [Pyrus ussuriensis x Pyrus communis]